MRSILKVRGGEDEEAEVVEEEEAVDEEEEVDEEEDDEEEDEAPVSGFDYATILQKALDITKEFVEVTKIKVFPIVSKYVLKLRGGEEEDTEAEEGDDDEEDEEEMAPSEGIDYNAIIQKAVDVTKEFYQMTKVKVFPVVSKYSVKGAVTAKKTSITVYKAIRRAISAAFEKDEEDEDDEDDDDEEGSTALDKVIAISKKTVAVVKRMVKAAMTVPDDEASAEEDDEEEEVTAEDGEEETTTESEPTEAEEASDSPATDFGSYLSEGYGVDDERNSGKGEGVTILGGSLADALQTARQEARMLLAFIPADKPEGERGGFFGRKKGSPESDEADKVAIESLLSPEVSKAANRKSRKMGDGSGSFAIWGAKAGSPEAAAAIKQLKVKETSTKGDARPVMCVVYPPSVSFSSCFLPVHVEISRYPLLKCTFSSLSVSIFDAI